MRPGIFSILGPGIAVQLTWLALGALLASVAGCNSSTKHTLLVSLRTDLVPVHEFATVELNLVPIDKTGMTRRLLITPSESQFLEMSTLAELDELESDAYRLRVTLLNDLGVGLTVRPVLVDLFANTAASLRISRSCLSIDCGDDMACLGGQCVDLRCTVETPDYCGDLKVCQSDQGCQAGAACAQGYCDEGMCWYGGAASDSSALCDAATQWCHPDSGCTESGSAPLVPRCDDGQQNGGETGVDCGGSCSRCEGELSPVIEAHCIDGEQNAGEQGIDCGGSCTPCPDDDFCTEQSAVAVHECRALYALYQATPGPEWVRAPEWFTSTELCAWQGTTCAAGTITQLDSPIPSLAGTIPPELGNLRHLTDLSLDRNALTGTVPPELGLLPQLRTLFLGRNRLTGTIPPELTQLSVLQYFDLSSNALSGTLPPELGRLTQIEEINVSNNHLEGSLPESIGSLSTLSWLYTDYNRFSGPIPESFSGLTNLFDWIGSNSGLTGTIPAGFAALPQLDVLLLEGNALEGEIPREFVNGGILSLSIDYNACLWHLECEDLAPILDIYAPDYQATNRDPECAPPDNACP